MENYNTKKKTNNTKKDTKTRKSHAKCPLYSHAKLYATKITSTKSTLSQTSPSFVGTSSSDEKHSSIPLLRRHFQPILHTPLRVAVQILRRPITKLQT